MGDVTGDHEGLGLEARARVRVRFSVRCTGLIGLWLQLGTEYNVWLSAILRFRFMLRCG